MTGNPEIGGGVAIDMMGERTIVGLEFFMRRYKHIVVEPLED